MKSILAILFFMLALPAGAATKDEEAARYIKIFNGDKSLHSDAADSFAYTGMSDPHVFDVIEARLLADHRAARDDRAEKNRVARYIRALGFSGQDKYQSTIRSFLKDPVYERYAKAALEDLPHYRVWNPIISDRAHFDPKYEDDINRVRNMLRSGDLMLMRLGAKRVYFGVRNEELFELLAQALRSNYTSTDPQYADAIAWFAKALGSSKDSRYRSLLQEAAQKGTPGKIRDHAYRALSNLE